MKRNYAAVDHGRPILIDTRQAARALGVSEPTVWRLLRDGVLQKVKIGGCTRIRSTDLDKLAGVS